MVCSVPCSTSFIIPGKKRDQRDAQEKDCGIWVSLKMAQWCMLLGPKKNEILTGLPGTRFFRQTLFAAYTLNRTPWGFWVWSQVSSKNLTHSKMRETEAEMCLGRLHLATLWTCHLHSLWHSSTRCQNIRRTPSYLVRLWMVLSGTGILS